jgi:hypothetical protein
MSDSTPRPGPSPAGEPPPAANSDPAAPRHVELIRCLPGASLELHLIGHENKTVEISLDRDNDSSDSVNGGHHHDSVSMERNAVGHLDQTEFTMPAGPNTPENPVRLRYQAPDVAGDVMMQVFFDILSSNDMVQYRISVGIDGLEKLTNSPGITVEIGGEPRFHQFGSLFYGTKDLLDRLKALGASFYDQFKREFRIRRISLIRGGLLDINNDWRPPLVGHHDGRDVDLLLRGLPAEMRTWLKTKAQELGFTEGGECGADPEEDLWHLSIEHGQQPPPSGDASASIKPKIVAHQMGTMAQPGPEVRRTGTPYVARLAIAYHDDSDDDPPPPAVLASRIRTPDNSDGGFRLDDDCIMTLDLSLAHEGPLRGAFTLELPAGVRAANEQHEILQQADLHVELERPIGRLKALASGRARIFLKALDSFVGGALTLNVNSASDQIILQHVDVIAPKAPAYIQPHRDRGNPEMPRLIARLPVGTAAMQVQWRLRVQYIRGNSKRPRFTLPQDYVDIPGRPHPELKPADAGGPESNMPTFTAPMASNEQWSIFESPEWIHEVNLGFFGGEATLYCRTGDDDTGPVAVFRLGGRNPDNAACRRWLESHPAAAPDGELWFAYAIAKEETAEYRFKGSLYHQFSGIPKNPKKPLGYPTWHNDGAHKPGGYGIFQVTAKSIPREQIWNWQKNIEAALRELAEKRKDAVRWMKEQHDAANGKALPALVVGRVTFAEGSNRTMIDAVTMKNYNGHSLLSNVVEPEMVKSEFILDSKDEQSEGYFCYWKEAPEDGESPPDAPNHDEDVPKPPNWALCRYNAYDPTFNYVRKVCDEVE